MGVNGKNVKSRISGKRMIVEIRGVGFATRVLRTTYIGYLYTSCQVV